ncbi:MAG TPA: putative baseplate assembly protein [Pyrinomonadaceae bacterium]|nr:putative baseplate assembly protein [Pyrinomonadaceae bacterium]
MSRRVSLPKIDDRKAEHLLRQLRRMAPHYTREWAGKDDEDPGVALLKIFSTIAEGVISRLNRAPDRNFLAFLDMLGIRLLPKSPARVPVTFRLANGTEAPFLVPNETQVSAAPNAERPEELPFETIEPLWAIPAKLTELFVVDPAKDRIYKPPAKFLALEKVGNELPPLRVTAFSSQGSKFLQLEPPDQVKKDDFLRIDTDHLVVFDARGSIVTVTDPLPRDYVEDTAVKRVTEFELFEARNWQEHVLYLGHADYFAIKSEAQIELEVEQAGTTANLEPLNVVWEFFGVTETEEEEEWRRFEVDLDSTQGFSRNGNVVLNKPAGEIKEKEIDGRKNRWIRARLDGPLPATPERLMPTVESVLLKVSSEAAGIAPDQAFHNETPLTTDVEFFPFGTEPRTFDRFAIASEEAFSKHGAEINLNFEFDPTELLASPAGVVDDKTFRIFARTVGGKLLEFKVSPESSDLEVDSHDSPKDTRILPQSESAVVIDAAGNAGAFVNGEDGKIHLRFISPDPKSTKWVPLGSTPGTLQFNPAAIFNAPNWQVFAVADNRLYQQTRTPAEDDGGSWEAIQDPPAIDSTPFVLSVGRSFAVFVTDTKNKTWMFRSTWSELVPNTPDPDFDAAKNARPFAVPYTVGNDQHFKVFLRSKNDDLIVLDTDKTNSKKQFGTPAPKLASDPTVVETSPGNWKVYVRGQDNHLWSLDVTSENWTDHQIASDIDLDGNPFTLCLFDDGKPLHVSTFSTSAKNALLEFRVSGEVLTTGTLQAGPHQVVLLKQSPSQSGTYYFHVLAGPGMNSSGDAVRKLTAPVRANDEFRVLDSPLDAIPTEGTQYELLREESSGKVQAATDTTLTLETDDFNKVIVGDKVYVNGQLRRISQKRTNNEVTIAREWTTNPNEDDDYVVLRAEPAAKLTASSATRAVLDPRSQQQKDGFYNGKFLQITSGQGAREAGRRIEKYFKSTNNILLRSAFAEAPTFESTYSITPGPIPEAWFVHKDPEQSKLRPELSWEYWNGRGWLALKITKDETDKLLIGGNIRFVIPDDIEKTEVAGQENYWIRARIVGGDYGREQFKFNKDTFEVTVQKDPIRPPKVIKSTKGSGSGLTIKYKLTELKQPEFCLTFNNLSYLDQTAANNTADKHFKPYFPLEDKSKAVYFGFDREFAGGPVRLYVEAKELHVDDRDQPELTWEFASENTWKPMSATDKTKAFTRPEFVTWIVPIGLQNRGEFGKALYWLRATLTKGDWKQSPLFKGVFLNTVAAHQARTVRNEILGSSTAVKNQKYRFQQVPVLKGEEVRVLETLTDNQREQLVKEQGDDVMKAITDQRGEVLQTWIRWTEVIEFFDSKPDSRVYRLDRHTGEIEFGDGVRGRIPPPGGDSIQAFSYQTGGGVAGNVPPGEITAAVTAVTGVDSVINPVGAGGGSEAATNEEMLEIGPAQISHRDRAVTPEDFERLAREASREVRKALCLPNRNAGGRHELGWTSVYIVPASKAATPTPTLALRRSVQDFLAKRADVTLVHQDHIFVGPPKYVLVSVEVTVVAKSVNVVAAAEQSVRQKLEQFLHPLTGGPANEGWDFGRDLAASDLYALLEDIDDVDHIATLRMVFGDSASEEKVDVEDHALVASGTHKISMDIATENR